MKYTRTLGLLMSFLTLVVGLRSHAEENQTVVPVFSGGRFQIVLHPNASSDPFLASAIADFRRSLSLMTGTAVPDKAVSGEIPIIFRIKHEVAGDVTATEARNWGDFHIEVTEREIAIDAISPLGAANALYTLLDHWGCRWIMPGEIGEVIPRKGSLNLPTGRMDGTLSTDMRVTTGVSWYPAGEEWRRRNRHLPYQRWLTAQHHWGKIVPKETYFDPQKPETYKPEYYALVGGKRTPAQICTSNPEVVELAIAAAKERFRKNPEIDSFPVDPNDNLDFCQCEECLKLDPPGLTPEGLPQMTDRVVDFANKIARGIRKEFPEKKVGFYSYMNHSLPPVKIKPEPEIIVGVTRSNYDLLRLTPRTAGDSASHFYELLKNWRAAASYVFTYEYNPIFWNGNLLCPNYLGWAKTLKDVIALGTDGIYSDGQLAMKSSVNFLTYYFQFRMSTDASLDPATELRDICTSFYGPVAREMLDYYLTMSKVEDYDGKEMISGGLRNYHRMFSPEMIREARRHLDEAIGKCEKKEPFAERVRLADLSHKYLEAYLEGVWKAQEGDLPGSNAAFDRMEKLIHELGETGLLSSSSDRGGVEDTLRDMKAARLRHLADSFSEEYGIPRQWRLLGPLDNSDRGAELRLDPFEPLRSVEGEIKPPHGPALSWTTYTNPHGFLNFREAFPKLPVSWSAFYAYAGFQVNVPTKRAAEFKTNSFNSYRVFLNGREVFYRAGWSKDEPDRYVTRVILEKGINTIIVKSTHTSDTDSHPWGLWFRITDGQGEPFKDLEFVK